MLAPLPRAARPPERSRKRKHSAGVAQLVERDLPKVDVVGSNPISRSVKGKKIRGMISRVPAQKAR